MFLRTDGANIENLSQCAYTIELDFSPTRLFHTYVVHRIANWNYVENVFLLLGQDKRIHTFVEDRGENQFMAVATGRLFPELAVDFGSVPTAADVVYMDPKSEYRFSAVCTEGGHAYAKVAALKTVKVFSSNKRLSARSLLKFGTVAAAAIGIRLQS